MGVGAIPRSVPIILKDDLVDLVKAGGVELLEFFFQFFSDLCPRTLGTHDTFKTLRFWIIQKKISLFLFRFGTDDVVVTGVLTAKWSPDLKDVRCDLDPVLIANNVRLVSDFYYQNLIILTELADRYTPTFLL